MFYDMFCVILCCIMLKKLIRSATIIEIARSVVKDQGQTLILFNLVSKSSPVFNHFIFRCNKVLEYECGYSFCFEEFRICFTAEVDAVVVCFHLKGEGSFRIFWYCWELLVLADMRRYRHVIIKPTEGQIIWLFFFDKLNKWCNYLALETFTSANQNFENGEIWWNTYGEGE